MLEKNNIGNILKEARKRRSLTQQELADRAFLTRQAISKYELNVSQMSVENFMLLLDILDTSVVLEGGKIKIIEEKNMKKIGYIKINAYTTKFISENMDKFISEFKRHGIEVIDIFELKETVNANINDLGCLDEAFYITLDFKYSEIEENIIRNPYYNDKGQYIYHETELFKILNNIQTKFNNLNINLLSYYPSNFYNELDCTKLKFEDIDLIDVKLRNYYKNFNPNNYDTIFPTIRVGYQRVKKDGLYGFIDSFTGKEVIPCKFDFVQAFDYNFKDHHGNLIARARLNGKEVIIDRKGNVLYE